MYKKALFVLALVVGISLAAPELAAAQAFSWNEPLRMLRDNLVNVTLPILGAIFIIALGIMSMGSDTSTGLARMGNALFFLIIALGAVAIVAALASMI